MNFLLLALYSFKWTFCDGDLNCAGEDSECNEDTLVQSNIFYGTAVC